MIRGPAAVSSGELSSNHMQEYNTLPVGKLQLDHLTAILLRNIPVKFFNNRLRFDRIMVMSLWPRFLAHPVYIQGGPKNWATDSWP